jgi:nitronate monooxygenase
MSHEFLQRIGVDVPIVQAPMAGVGTPALAAAVANAGALGSLGIGALGADAARAAILAVRAATSRPFGVNVFCHRPPRPDAARERAWLARWGDAFTRFAVEAPARLRAPYGTFVDDAATLEVLLDTRPPLVSFHFGLPGAERIAALRDAGTVLLATVTSVDEGRAAQAAGVDAVVAQGIEAGGHRGTFDPEAPDDGLTTLVLTRLLVRALAIPVIAAGGIMDGAGIAAVLRVGACAAQLGTAFIACPESAADAAFRADLLGTPPPRTMMTHAVSGRAARCIRNAFATGAARGAGADVPDYPIAYDAAKAVMAAARQAGEPGYAVHFAGQGAPLARALPAAEMIAVLREEIAAAGRADTGGASVALATR